MMFPRVASAPSVEPVSLPEALAHLREQSDGAENDAYIEGLIQVARKTCEDRTERSLVSTGWLLTLEAFPADGVLMLKKSPVIAVQSVQYLDQFGDLQTLAADQYQVDVSSEPGRLLAAPDAQWPDTQAGAWNAVRITFTAGYGPDASNVPAPLKQWMLLAIGTLYNLRNADGERQAIPHAFADALLQPYRVLGV